MSVARGLVLVDAGQAVAEEGALDVMEGGGAGAVERDGGECLINLAVEAEGAAGHRNPLGLVLSLVADGFVGGDGVEDASLGASQNQVGDGLVVEAEGVIRGAGAFDGKKGGQGGLVGSQAGANPGGERFGGFGPAGVPGMEGIDCGGNGRDRGFGGHGRQFLQSSRVPQASGLGR